MPVRGSGLPAVEAHHRGHVSGKTVEVELGAVPTRIGPCRLVVGNGMGDVDGPAMGLEVHDFSMGDVPPTPEASRHRDFTVP